MNIFIERKDNRLRQMIVMIIPIILANIKIIRSELAKVLFDLIYLASELLEDSRLA
jgi:hypothetical protein